VPHVAVIAGPNGAGKSTVAPVLLGGHPGIVNFVNADVIARGLSALDPESVAIQAGRIMLDRLNELARQRADFAFETTLASRSFAPWLTRLIEDGYVLELVYLWIGDPDLCVARVASRVQAGGHYVADDIVRRRYAGGLRNFFSLYRCLAEIWQFHDNSDVERRRLIAKGEHDVTQVVHDEQLWQEIIQRFGQPTSP
jgi:predicted ABC-type ATPase